MTRIVDAAHPDIAPGQNIDLVQGARVLRQPPIGRQRLVDELERINPKSETGSRKSKHHQWLSTDIGHVALAQHLHAVLGFMRACKSWDQFIGMLDIAFPKKGRTIPLQLE